MKAIIRSGVAGVVCALLAACGGGGGGGGGTTTASAPLVTAPSTPVSPSATFSLTIPAATASSVARSAQSVSPGTQSFVVALNSVNGVAQTTSVTTNTNSSACTASTAGTTCAVQIVAPSGTDVFTVTLYAGLGATGSVLGSATAPETISANGVNRVTLAVNGVVAALHLFLTSASGTIGTAQTSTAYVVALDATGAQIVLPGSYTAPITVTSSDASGHVLLTVNGGTPAASVQITSPQDALAVVFNGAGAVQLVTITAAATGVTGSSASYTVIGNPPVLTPNSVTFTQLGASGAQTVSVSGGLAPYLVNGTTASSGSPAIAYSISGNTITLTANGAGSVTFTVSDALGQTAQLTASASTLTVPIQ